MRKNPLDARLVLKEDDGKGLVTQQVGFQVAEHRVLHREMPQLMSRKRRLEDVPQLIDALKLSAADGHGVVIRFTLTRLN